MTVKSMFPKNHDRNLQNFCRNIHNVVTIKLDHDNFSLWRAQITLSLTAYQLLSFVDGSSPKPADTAKDLSALQPPAAVSAAATDDVAALDEVAADSDIWHQTNALILSNILSVISPSLLPKLSHHTTCSSLWTDLLETYTTLSVAHIHQLKSELLAVKKIGSMEEYLDKLKLIADRLALAGAPMSDLDLVHQTVLSLPVEYDAVTTIIRTTNPPIPFARVYAMLRDEELVVMRKEKGSLDDQTKALLARSSLPSDVHQLELQQSIPLYLSAFAVTLICALA